MQKTTLNRVISLPLLVFYGVGTTLGAGVYALTGKIAGLSGQYAPVSFFLASVIAGFVAFSYAELSSRYPESAGEAAFVHKAFSQSWLTTLVGWAVAFTGIASAGVMTLGFYAYLNEFIQLPEIVVIFCFILLITSIAIIGISLSITFVAMTTLIEICGILLVLFVCREHLLTVFDSWQFLIPPPTWNVWKNILLGAFLAFYAFIGFEDIVNVAEEATNPEQNLPRAIISCLVITTVFYVMVALASVLSLPIEKIAHHDAPFALIIKENSQIPVYVISLISLIAILNGALVQIIMASRIIYGLAARGMAPTVLGYLHPKTRTPINATLLFAILLMVFTLWLPIESLANLASFVILMIFALVNFSLCYIKLTETTRSQVHLMQVWIVVPVIGLILCLSFIILQVVNLIA